MDPKQQDFLVKDYELKVRYLTDHFSRMWTRFNFFLTLESGLLGGKIIFGEGDGLDISIALVLLVISFVWYIVGAQDRHLVTLYRSHLKNAGVKISQMYPELNYTEFVGNPEEHPVSRGVTEWYSKPFSITRLAALLPLLLSLFWAAVTLHYFYTSSCPCIAK